MRAASKDGQANDGRTAPGGPTAEGAGRGGKTEGSRSRATAWMTAKGQVRGTAAGEQPRGVRRPRYAESLSRAHSAAADSTS